MRTPTRDSVHGVSPDRAPAGVVARSCPSIPAAPASHAAASVARPARVWAEIDLQAVNHNLDAVRTCVGDAVAIIAVVKADAYGHGAVAISRALAGARVPVDMLAVGDSQEALELRAAGIDLPILILGAIVPGEIEAVVAHGITPCVHGVQDVRRLEEEAARHGRTIPVHVLVDTGMARLGVSHHQVGALLRDVRDAEHLELEGLATHFSSAGEATRAFTHRQLERFHTAREAARALGLSPRYVHAANSPALFNYDNAHGTAVRPGLMLYGLGTSGPSPRARAVDAPASPTLRPVLAWRTQVAFVREALPEGVPVSYGRQHYTTAPTDLAVIPVGYNDGYRRGFSGRARVIIRGIEAPVVGAITMDYAMVEVGHIPGVDVGDVVTLLGRDGLANITLDDLAEWGETVPHEITCGLGKRVARRFRTHRGGAYRPESELDYGTVAVVA